LLLSRANSIQSWNIAVLSPWMQSKEIFWDA